MSVYREISDTESGPEKVSQPQSMSGEHIYTVGVTVAIRRHANTAVING